MSRRAGDDTGTKPIDHPDPVPVWECFSALSAIPRCSRREERARAWVMERAEKRRLACRVDTAGNLVVRKEASPGMESSPPVVLQGHLDMVCEKNRDTTHDFERHGIVPVRDGDWISARGTTLGADNGIAVAMMVALLESEEPTGPLECLFTVDEESGLTGAMGLDPSLISGRILINLDSEEEGFFYIGCAGGCNTSITLPVVREMTRPGRAGDDGAAASAGDALRVTITGLRGGHSGVNIHEERANSIVLGARLLKRIRDTHPSVLVGEISGGGKHNAIPREVWFDLVCPEPEFAGPRQLEKTIRDLAAVFYEEIGVREPAFAVTTEAVSLPASVLAPTAADTLVRLLLAIPQGVLGTSATVPGLVETSTNLAAISLEGDTVRILTSQRSSRESLIDRASESIESLALLAGGTARRGERYPAWTPNATSALLDTATNTYRQLFGAEPTVTAVHAGLECGVIRDRVGPMDMVSFGPNLEGAHTPEERISISSTLRTWQLLLGILRAL
jgi:dipeptidase D